MLLAMDIGNTNTVLALFDPDGTCQHTWRLTTRPSDTIDELHGQVFTFFAMSGLSLDCVSDVALSCVVPSLLPQWKQMLKQALDCEPLVIDSTLDTGVELNVVDSRKTGPDRIANSVAAVDAYGAPTIVVDFGTATNIDVIDQTGSFRGGPIMPGVRLSAKALFDRAAMLSSVPIGLPTTAIGNTTASAVQGGLVLGTAAQAEGLVRRIQEELAAEGTNVPRARVVATGGFASLIAQATDLFDAVDKDLTIRGIYLIWKRVRGK